MMSVKCEANDNFVRQVGVSDKGCLFGMKMDSGSQMRSAIVGNQDEEEVKKRRRTISKTQLVKKLKISFHNWNNRRHRLIDRRINAKESTMALLKKAKVFQNSTPSCVDPFTREAVNENANDVFSFHRGNGIAKIDAGHLIDYILSTGDYSDPESRIPFDDAALRKLDEIGSKIGKPSVMKARTELQAKFAERQFLRDAMCGLERICGESVSQMFDLVEQVNEDCLSIDEAQLQLLTYVIPEFEGNFTELVNADRSFAKQSAMHFEAFLKGPRNRPVKMTTIQITVLQLFSTAVSSALDGENGVDE